MTYGYYIEGHSNGIFFREYLEGYKTLKGVERARCKLLERQKIAETGRVLYIHSGGAKYDRASYFVQERFNAKAFFDFWN